MVIVSGHDCTAWTSWDEKTSIPRMKLKKNIQETWRQGGGNRTLNLQLQQLLQTQSGRWKPAPQRGHQCTCSLHWLQAQIRGGEQTNGFVERERNQRKGSKPLNVSSSTVSVNGSLVAGFLWAIKRCSRRPSSQQSQSAFIHSDWQHSGCDCSRHETITSYQ